MANADRIDIDYLADGDGERHHQAVPHHLAHRRGAGAFDAVPEHGGVVVQHLGARQQRQREREHALGSLRRGDEGDVQRKRDHHHARNQQRMTEENEPGAVFDHQYCTLRSM